ncbi:hypothetical protein [Desulfurispira natronophila]|uniref:Uncharacterized protein n=1 Tax=Desulfurispira natronophila TaxID=682562 RepID=A0A7W7Y5U9_9BACT|nr:hypothetical protein [Desulfurispira natronophila]MBB5022640.1 hypothetical protein [Desulfurispira natronophila]
MELDEALVEELSGLPRHRWSRQIHYFHQQPPQIISQILQQYHQLMHSTDFLQRLRTSSATIHQDREVAYAAFLRQITLYRQIEARERLALQRKDPGNISPLRDKQHKRVSHRIAGKRRGQKKYQILEHQQTIMQLRAEGYSWEKIRQYLKQEYRIDTNREYLRQIMGSHETPT